MLLTLRKQAAVARADGRQWHGKGKAAQRRAGRHSSPCERLPMLALTRKMDNRKKTTRFQ